MFLECVVLDVCESQDPGDLALFSRYFDYVCEDLDLVSSFRGLVEQGSAHFGGSSLGPALCLRGFVCRVRQNVGLS